MIITKMSTANMPSSFFSYFPLFVYRHMKTMNLEIWRFKYNCLNMKGNLFLHEDISPNSSAK